MLVVQASACLWCRLPACLCAGHLSGATVAKSAAIRHNLPEMRQMPPVRRLPRGRTTIFLILCLLPLFLASCGGGGGEAPDVTPPSISSVSITPQLLDHNGGAVQVTAQVSDNHAAPSALAVTAALIPAAGGEPVAGPTPMSIALSGKFTAAFAAPSNNSFAGTDDDYFARIAAADSSANPSSANGGTLTVHAMEGPPPPPL